MRVGVIGLGAGGERPWCRGGRSWCRGGVRGLGAGGG